MNRLDIAVVLLLCAAICPCLPVMADASPEASPSDAGQPAQQSAAELVRSGKALVRPLAAADLAAAQRRLEAALGRLDTRLDGTGALGEGWRKYLKTDELEAQLAAEEPDLKALMDVYSRFAGDDAGLSMVWLVDVREALRDYLEIARNVGNESFETALTALLDSLAEAVEQYDAAPTEPQAAAIAGLLRQARSFPQMDGLVADVRAHYAEPNIRVKVAGSLIAAGLAGPVDETRRLSDVILGTSLTSDAHTVGERAVDLVPSSSFGVLDILFAGVNNAWSRGRNGPVSVSSHSVTRLAGRKRLWVSEDGIAAYPAVSSATTQTTITGLNARSAIVQRAAQRRASQQKYQAQRIAASRAEGRLNRRMDQEAADAVARANKAFRNDLVGPLKDHNLYPELLRFSTTSEALSVVATSADTYQLAAPVAAPEAPEADFSVRVHQSAICNAAVTALAGMKLTDDRVRDLAEEISGSVPEQLEASDEAWAIAFPRQRPVTVSFGENRLEITIRGRRFFRDGESHPAMNVTAAYKIASDAEGVKLLRDGDLKIYPPDFKPDEGRRLSARQVVIRRLLQRRFENIFEPEIVPKPVELPGKWEEAGSLRLATLSSANGWVTAGWRVAK